MHIVAYRFRYKLRKQRDTLYIGTRRRSKKKMAGAGLRGENSWEGKKIVGKQVSIHIFSENNLLIFGGLSVRKRSKQIFRRKSVNPRDRQIIVHAQGTGR